MRRKMSLRKASLQAFVVRSFHRNQRRRPPGAIIESRPAPLATRAEASVPHVRQITENQLGFSDELASTTKITEYKLGF